jgi:hypothetical protein
MVMALPLGAGERVTMKVAPSVSFAPANLVVRTMVEADANNRAIEVVAESQDFYRSSQIELDGDRAPLTATIEFRNLPSGRYDVKATVIGTSGQPLGFVRREVSVLGSGAAR